MTRVGVISDWSRAPRGNAWPDLLSELDPAPQVTVYPIGELLVRPKAEDDGLQHVNQEQVLIVNWDVANGDPEFGAQLCQKWLEHRRPEIIEWVRKGGILLIESQATLGVPSVDAYDAITGKGELATSGLEDSTRPLESVAPRSGKVARKTKRFPGSLGFGAVEDRIVARDAYPQIAPFPSTTTGLLIDALRTVDTGVLLWRGVFRRTLPYSRRFGWISIIETEGRHRQSIMKVAKLGDGAIFASTMMLASTGQRDLVAAIIRCADGNNQHLPSPVAGVELVKNGVKLLLTIFGGAVAALIVANSSTIVSKLSAIGVPASEGSLEGWVKLLLLPLGIGMVVIGHRLVGRLRRFVRDVLGY